MLSDVNPPCRRGLEPTAIIFDEATVLITSAPCRAEAEKVFQAALSGIRSGSLGVLKVTGVSG